MLTLIVSNIMLFWRFFLMVKKIILLPLCHSRATAMPYSVLPLCHTLLPLCHTFATAMPCLCYRYAIPLLPLCHAFSTAMSYLFYCYVIPIATAMPYPLLPLCHTHCDRYAMPLATAMPYLLLPLCHTPCDRYAILLNQFFYDFFGLKTNDMDLVFVIYGPGLYSSNFHKIIK